MNNGKLTLHLMMILRHKIENDTEKEKKNQSSNNLTSINPFQLKDSLTLTPINIDPLPRFFTI